MNNYKEYINKLKGMEVRVDYGQLFAQIENKIAGKSIFGFPRVSFAVAGALAVLLIGFAVYFSGLSSNDDALMAYVFAPENGSDNVVMAYVFVD